MGLTNLPDGIGRNSELRFCEYVKRFAGTEGPVAGYYPGLSARQSCETADFPIVRDLESSFNAIRSEVQDLDPLEFHHELEAVHRTGSWEVFMLFERGRKDEVNCARCPTIVKIIEEHRTVRDMMGLCYVSRMSPGTRIAAHCGPTNLRLRCHLAISVPKGDCRLRVGAETMSWEEGKCLVFDDFLEHESWNSTGGIRTVLIADLWHPDLTDEEVHLLRGLHGYAASEGSNLHRYWVANAKAKDRRRAHFD